MKMKSFCRRRCIVIVCLMMTLVPVNLQIPMGMPMPPPMFAMPPQMPIGVPVPVPMIIRGQRSTAFDHTAITEVNKGIEQIPLPVEISIYPPRSDRYPNLYPSPYPGPPPGPFPLPYAAPPFGVPLPMPMMPPPPLFVKPGRHKKQKRHKKRDPSSCNCGPISDEESCSDETRQLRKGTRIKRTFRRIIRSDEIEDNLLVKPMLTYVSQNGDVKLKKRLSNNDAADLIDEDKSFQKLSVLAGQDADNKPRILVVSDQQNNDNSNHRHRQVILRTGSAQHAVGEGRKELVFRPPGDKKISNLSVSFQVGDR